MNKDIIKNFVIGLFIMVPLASSIISGFHLIEFLKLGNSIQLAITIAIIYEICSIATLYAIVIMDRLNAYFVWSSFILITFLQYIGNVYYSFDFILLKTVDSNSWIDHALRFLNILIGQSKNADINIFILSVIIGVPIPTLSLFLTKSLTEYLKSKDEQKTVEPDKIDADLEDGINKLKETIENLDKNTLKYPKPSVQIDPITVDDIKIANFKDRIKEFDISSTVKEVFEHDINELEVQNEQKKGRLPYQPIALVNQLTDDKGEVAPLQSLEIHNEPEEPWYKFPQVKEPVTTLGDQIPPLIPAESSNIDFSKTLTDKDLSIPEQLEKALSEELKKQEIIIPTDKIIEHFSDKSEKKVYDSLYINNLSSQHTIMENCDIKTIVATPNEIEIFNDGFDTSLITYKIDEFKEDVKNRVITKEGGNLKIDKIIRLKREKNYWVLNGDINTRPNDPYSVGFKKI